MARGCFMRVFLVFIYKSPSLAGYQVASAIFKGC